MIDYSTVPYTTEAQKEEYTRAVAQAMETDAFIGGLRERLEADGHAEDTVLMLFTDHYCKYFPMPSSSAPSRARPIATCSRTCRL